MMFFDCRKIFAFFSGCLLLVFVSGFKGCVEKKRAQSEANKKKRKMVLMKNVETIGLEKKSPQEKYRAYLLMLGKRPRDLDLQFKLARCCEELGKFEEAASRYKFCRTFASEDSVVGDERVSLIELSRYLEIVSEKKNAFARNIHCDVNPLEKTIRLSELYLRNGYLYEKDKVAKILADCRDRLLEKKELIVEYHLTKNNIDAARSVLARMKEEFADIDSIAERSSFLECKILKQKGDLDKARDLLLALEREFPDSAWTNRARGLVGSFLPKRGAEAVSLV